MNRIPLKSETTIKYIDKEYIVDSVIGSGATCIVYSAHYIDKVGITHNIRLKECYPYNTAVTRVNNEIIWESESEKKQVLSSFIVGYEKLMKNQMGNYSVNAFDLVNANGTYYILMDYNEGTTFDKEKCVTIYDVLYTIKLLAYVVGEYHKNGYLHLDIKPENFLVYPRPSEHIILFDMDSITAIEDIRKGKVKSVSYSMKWAAPEQAQRKLSKICPATDIFSIGAVLFYKIMGRNVSNEDIGIFSEWNFEQPLFEKVNPKLKLHLSKIFKKTLAVNINRRYQNTDELIVDIDEAMECARFNSPYVMSNFPSAKSVFVGRGSELSQLRQIMNDNRVVFLSGIGGIGKTSLVLEYLRQSKREFGTILFLRYDDNIDKTLKTSDIVFRNYKESEKSSNIINGLSELMDENDLIIIDNFDNIDNINELNEFIDNSGIQCKIIITTRIYSSALSDMGLCSMQINEMTQADIENLFCVHNGINYNDDEKRILRDIFRNFEFHTLCVELIAKYLRIKAVKPSEFRDRIYNSLQGISEFDDVKIIEQKDNRIERRSMQKHIEALFDITLLNNEHMEILSLLSLFGNVRVSKKFFLECMAYSNRYDLLDEIINMGWIAENDENQLSMHPLVLSAVTEKCNGSSSKIIPLFSTLTKKLSNYNALNNNRQSLLAYVCGNAISNVGKMYCCLAKKELLFEYCKMVDSFDFSLRVEKIEAIFDDSIVSEYCDIYEKVEFYLLKAKSFFFCAGRYPYIADVDEACLDKVPLCFKSAYKIIKEMPIENVSESNFSILERINEEISRYQEGFSWLAYELKCGLLNATKEISNRILSVYSDRNNKVEVCLRLLRFNHELCNISNRDYICHETNCLSPAEIVRYSSIYKEMCEHDNIFDMNNLLEALGLDTVIQRFCNNRDFKLAAQIYKEFSEMIDTFSDGILNYYYAMHHIINEDTTAARENFIVAYENDINYKMVSNMLDEIEKHKNIAAYRDLIVRIIENELSYCQNIYNLLFVIELYTYISEQLSQKQRQQISNEVLICYKKVTDADCNCDREQYEYFIDGICELYDKKENELHYFIVKEFVRKHMEHFERFSPSANSKLCYKLAIELYAEQNYRDSFILFEKTIGMFGSADKIEYFSEFLSCVEKTINIEDRVLGIKALLKAYDQFDWNVDYYNVDYVQGKTLSLRMSDYAEKEQIFSHRLYNLIIDIINSNDSGSLSSLDEAQMYYGLARIPLANEDERNKYASKCNYSLIAQDKCRHLSAYEQASEWDMAASAYTCIDKYKEAYKCYKKARELYYFDDDSERKHVLYSVHNATYSCIECLCKYSDTESAKKELDTYVSEIMEIVKERNGQIDVDLGRMKIGEMLTISDLVYVCWSAEELNETELFAMEYLLLIKGLLALEFPLTKLSEFSASSTSSTSDMQRILFEILHEIQDFSKSKYINDILGWCSDYSDFVDYNLYGSKELRDCCTEIYTRLSIGDFAFKY